MTKEKDCKCPEIDQSDWTLQSHNWGRKAFYQTKHRRIFHMPIGIGKSISKGIEGIKEKGFTMRDDSMILDEERGRFSARTLIEINEIPHDPDVHIIEAGKIYSHYYHGEFRGMKAAIEELINFYKENEDGREPHRFFTWTTNCPDCWKEDGGPIVVLLAK